MLRAEKIGYEINACETMKCGTKNARLKSVYEK